MSAEKQTDTGVGIDADPAALREAGVQLDSPAPPDPELAAALPNLPDAAAASEANRLRAELAEWRHRAELAEALAAERADTPAEARAALTLQQRPLQDADEADSAPGQAADSPHTQAELTPQDRVDEGAVLDAAKARRWSPQPRPGPHWWRGQRRKMP